MPQLLVLFESASGYALLEVAEGGDAASLKADVQAAVTDLARFSKMVKLRAFMVRALPRRVARRPPPRATSCRVFFFLLCDFAFGQML